MKRYCMICILIAAAALCGCGNTGGESGLSIPKGAEVTVATASNAIGKLNESQTSQLGELLKLAGEQAGSTTALSYEDMLISLSVAVDEETVKPMGFVKWALGESETSSGGEYYFVAPSPEDDNSSLLFPVSGEDAKKVLDFIAEVEAEL